MMEPGPELGANCLQRAIRFRGPRVKDDQNARRELMDGSVLPAPLPFGVEDRQSGGKTRRDRAGQELNPRRVRDAAKIQFGSHPRLRGERPVRLRGWRCGRSGGRAAGDEKKKGQRKDAEQGTAVAGRRRSHGQDVNGGPVVWESPETAVEVWARFGILQERRPWNAGIATDTSSRILATTPSCGAS